ncbi:hypothetical protein FAK_09730 [Desulfoferula mesophila]|uniref:Uncharacterized protein n=2 Tax=Desulfoferula mesophila TaxID=3058419 RepID=A0AAU9EYQ5_9BACT|nr:hypothetical protein FAK_09730 [Desulfoferula mesophilus]
MGWGAALLEYTRPRQRPSQWDTVIYQQLQGASNTAAAAYNSCRAYIPAWSDWRQKQQWLAQQINDLQRVNNHRSWRNRVYQNVAQSYNSWANQLSIMRVNNRIIRATTCSTCYFRLGYASAYVSQALRQANEALNRNRNRQEAGRQLQLARDHLQRMLSVLRVYREIQMPRGSFIIRCSNLNRLNLGNRIQNLFAACRSLNNLPGKIQAANQMSDQIGNTLLNDCIPRRGAVNRPGGPGSGPGGGGSGGSGGREICGDGIDNNGNNLIDEGCNYKREIILDDDECPDDTVGLVVDGRKLGNTPPGNKRHFDVSYLRPGRHTIIVLAVRSGGQQYRCSNNKQVTYSVKLGKGIKFTNGRNYATGNIKEGSNRKYTIVVQ